MNDDTTLLTRPSPIESSTGGRRRRRRHLLLVALVVAVAGALALAVTTLGSSGVAPDDVARRHPVHRGQALGSPPEVARSTAEVAVDGLDAGPTGTSSDDDDASGAPADAAAVGPRLVVPTDLYPAPGDNGVAFVIANDGDAPLTWSVPQEDGPVPVVQPESGEIAPGGTQLVGFELPHPVVTFDGVYPFTVESDGGTAEVAVHLDALDPVFEIVDGTWNIRNGNTFLVAYGDMDIGLTVRNVGDAPLHVDPQEVDGLAVIGGPWDLAPGEEAHLHLVLCDAAYSGGIPDFHDRDVHIHTDGWQGTLDFGVRFTLAPDQAALPC